MNDQLRILIVEDVASDAELMERELKRGKISFSSMRVETKDAFLKALKDFIPDIILSDFSLPSFDGMSALRITKEQSPDTPFIFVSGSIGEEPIIETLTSGATDYVIKSRLNRLSLSVQRALKEVEQRTLIKQSEKLLFRLNRALKTISECNQVLVRVQDESELLHKICQVIVKVGGYRNTLIVFPKYDENKSVYAVASAGYKPGRLENLDIRWTDGEPQPGHKEIRLDKLFLVQNIFSVPHLKPWFADAIKDGISSLISLPLISNEQKLGAMIILTENTDAFDSEEVKLLTEMANDVAYGIMTLRSRLAQKQIEQKYRILFESSSEGILVADIQTRKFKYANPSICKMLGYSETELEKMDVSDIHPKDALPQVIAEFEAQARREKILAEGLPCLRKDGVIIYANINAAVAMIDGIKCNIGFFTDVTERKKAEEYLLVSAQQWRRTFDAISDIVCIVNMEGKTLQCNKAIVNLLKKPVNEIIGRPCWENFHGTSGQIKECPFERMKQTLRKETTIAQIDNKWYEITVDPLKDDAGNLIGAVHIMSDITEHRKLEEQLLRAQKLESVGTLSGGIAHDFNNLLGAIKGYAELSLMDTGKTSPIYEYLKHIVATTDRAGNLTRQLLIFSKSHSADIKPLNLNEAVNNMLNMLGRLIGEDIAIETELSPDLAIVNADAGNMEQVLMNLTINARDAMPNGGQISIKTENIAIDEKYCRLDIESRCGNFVCLSVQDTGTGISKEVMAHIFEPFFTTKPQGKGTGLGLSVVYGIVKKHSGWVNVYSEPSGGAIFKIYLPAETSIKAGASKPDTRIISPDKLEGKGERVLVVEDDEDIRKLVTKALEKMNYNVFAASTGSEAEQLFAREKGDFRLILSDVVLPDTNGVDLCDQLTKDRPGICVLLSSGYASRGEYSKDIRERGLTFIPKPYNLTTFFKTIRELLEK